MIFCAVVLCRHSLPAALCEKTEYGGVLQRDRRLQIAKQRDIFNNCELCKGTFFVLFLFGQMFLSFNQRPCFLFYFIIFLAVPSAGDLPVVPPLDTGNAAFGNEPVSVA